MGRLRKPPSWASGGYPDRSVEDQNKLSQKPKVRLLGPVIFQWNVEKT
jgi:hypothetical protein